jgi:hypothetical protein
MIERAVGAWTEQRQRPSAAYAHTAPAHTAQTERGIITSSQQRRTEQTTFLTCDLSPGSDQLVLVFSSNR